MLQRQGRPQMEDIYCGGFRRGKWFGSTENCSTDAQRRCGPQFFGERHKWKDLRSGRSNYGKVLIAGAFARINGIGRSRLARLNIDGSVDQSFDIGSGFDGTINDIAVQSDGKIIVGGIFQNYNGSVRQRIARINTNGSLDQTFDVGSPGLSNGATLLFRSRTARSWLAEVLRISITHWSGASFV